MWFGEDADAAQRFALGLLGWMLDGLDDDGKRRAVDNVTATLTAHDTGHGVLYGSAAWTIVPSRMTAISSPIDRASSSSGVA